MVSSSRRTATAAATTRDGGSRPVSRARAPAPSQATYARHWLSGVCWSDASAQTWVGRSDPERLLGLLWGRREARGHRLPPRHGWSHYGQLWRNDVRKEPDLRPTVLWWRCGVASVYTGSAVLHGCHEDRLQRVWPWTGHRLPLRARVQLRAPARLSPAVRVRVIPRPRLLRIEAERRMRMEASTPALPGEARRVDSGR